MSPRLNALDETAKITKTAKIAKLIMKFCKARDEKWRGDSNDPVECPRENRK